MAAFTIPVPVQVPPGSAATKNVLGFDSQKGPAGFIVASKASFTKIEIVSVDPQPGAV